MRLHGVPNLNWIPGYHCTIPMSFHGGWCCCDHVASAFLGVWRGAWEFRTWLRTAIKKHATYLLSHQSPSYITVSHLDFDGSNLIVGFRATLAGWGRFFLCCVWLLFWILKSCRISLWYWLLIKKHIPILSDYGNSVQPHWCDLMSHATGGGSKSTSRYSQIQLQIGSDRDHVALLVVQCRKNRQILCIA